MVGFLWGNSLGGRRPWFYGAVLGGNDASVCGHQILGGLLGTPVHLFSVPHHRLAVLLVDVLNGVGGVSPVGVLVLCAGMVSGPGGRLFGAPRETDDLGGGAAIGVTVVLRGDTAGVRMHHHAS